MYALRSSLGVNPDAREAPPALVLGWRLARDLFGPRQPELRCAKRSDLSEEVQMRKINSWLFVTLDGVIETPEK